MAKQNVKIGDLRLKNPETRTAVMDLLLRQGDEALIPCLKGLLADPKEEVRTAALEMAARCILDVGCEYRIGPLTLGLNIHNLLGTRYYRSGMNTNLIPQQGRWLMGCIAARF